jgi:hydrogenase maturation factor
MEKERDQVSEPGRGTPREPGEVCIICSDQGVILRVLRVAPDGSALAEGPDGRREEIRVDFIDAVAPGDVVLVHAGVALVRIRRDPGY